MIDKSIDFPVGYYIPTYSICEHQLLPFIGTAHVIYIPNQGKILVLSKIARIVDIISKNLNSGAVMYDAMHGLENQDLRQLLLHSKVLSEK